MSPRQRMQRRRARHHHAERRNRDNFMNFWFDATSRATASVLGRTGEHHVHFEEMLAAHPGCQNFVFDSPGGHE